MNKYQIDYSGLAGEFAEILKKHKGPEAPLTFDGFLRDQLPDLWCKAYARMPGKRKQIVQITDEFEFLFDLGSDRVVAAFGLTGHTHENRDARRMAGFLGKTTANSKLDALEKSATTKEDGMRRRHLAGLSFRQRFFETHGAKYDRGHFMSHKSGGQLDINLFPQLASVNQGDEYRTMEKTAVAQRGTFCFSRPIYDDDTWVPAQLEYGVLQSHNKLHTKVFPNR